MEAMLTGERTDEGTDEGTGDGTDDGAADFTEVTSSASASGAYSLAIEELRRWLRARRRGFAGDTGCVGGACVRGRAGVARGAGRTVLASEPAFPGGGGGAVSESLCSPLREELFSELHDERPSPVANRGRGGESGTAVLLLREASLVRRRANASAMGVVPACRWRCASSSLESLWPWPECELEDGVDPPSARYASADEYAVRPAESLLRNMGEEGWLVSVRRSGGARYAVDDRRG